MNIEYLADRAVFDGVVGVDEAEALLEWLQGNASASVDLKSCEHLHSANLQVLMAARPAIAAWPSDDALAAWLSAALQAPTGHGKADRREAP